LRSKALQFTAHAIAMTDTSHTAQDILAFLRQLAHAGQDAP
jgi:hypothetical protein